MTRPSSGEAAASVPDEIDQILLDALHSNGRATYEELSRIAGLSRPSCRARVQRLRAGGIVQIVGVVHPAVFGLNAYAHISIQIDGAALPVARLIAAYPDAPFVSLVSGPHCVIVELRCQDQAAIDARVAEIRSLPHVRAVDTVLYRRILKDTNFPPVEAYMPTEVDDLDRRMLVELQRDGRISFAELGLRAGLSPGAARTRILRLLDAGVLHVGARTYRGSRAGDQHTGFALGARTDGAEILSSLLALPQVDYLATTVGRCDIVGTLVTRNPVGTVAALDEIRQIPGVAALESWTHIQCVKESYELPPS